MNVLQLHQYSCAVFLACALVYQACVCQACVCQVSAQDDSAAIDQIQSVNCSCVMANQKTEIRFDDLRSDKSGAVTWQVTKDHRTLARGKTTSKQSKSENESDPPNDGHREGHRGNTTLHQLIVEFQAPDIKPGTVLELKLKLDFNDHSISKTLFLFPENPFALRDGYLDKLNIRLFDPVGDTHEILTSVDVPFERLITLASIDAVDSGLIIVGAGVQQKQNAQLAETIATAAKRGINVIWITPATENDRDLKFNLGQPRRMMAQSHTIIKQFDKRFDDQLWANQPNVQCRWEIHQDGGAVSLNAIDVDKASDVAELSDVYVSSEVGVSSDASELTDVGWPWIELEYPESTLIFCGFGIVKRWDDGPVARHLLWKMIEGIGSEN